MKMENPLPSFVHLSIVPKLLWSLILSLLIHRVPPRFLMLNQTHHVDLPGFNSEKRLFVLHGRTTRFVLISFPEHGSAAKATKLFYLQVNKYLQSYGTAGNIPPNNQIEKSASITLSVLFGENLYLD